MTTDRSGVRDEVTFLLNGQPLNVTIYPPDLTPCRPDDDEDDQ